MADTQASSKNVPPQQAPTRTRPGYGIFKVAYYAARWILGIIFIFAAHDKILNPGDFAAIVHNYQLLPDGLINLTALVLPWVELFTGFCLVAGRLLPGAVVLADMMLLIFMGVLLYNVHRGLDVSCGCFSTDASDSPMAIGTIVRDSGFLLIALFLSWATFRNNKFS